jgi:hypothetical protein
MSEARDAGARERRGKCCVYRSDGARVCPEAQTGIRPARIEASLLQLHCQGIPEE